MVTSSDFFQAMTSVFNISHKRNSFSKSTSGQWISEDGEELIIKLKKLLELRSDNDIELHIVELEKRRGSIRNKKQWMKFSTF